jgi:hypothetical protein
MNLKPGMVVIQQGNPHDFLNRIISYFNRSWWVHGWVVTGENEGVEAALPSIARLNSGGVKVLKIDERLEYMKSFGGDLIVMDLPNITDEQRAKVAETAKSFIGWRYGWLNCIMFALTQVWFKTTRKELVCSFLMCRSFSDGIGTRIFTEESVKQVPVDIEFRKSDMLHDYATPDEIFRYSILIEDFRIKGTE